MKNSRFELLLWIAYTTVQILKLNSKNKITQSQVKQSSNFRNECKSSQLWSFFIEIHAVFEHSAKLVPIRRINDTFQELVSFKWRIFEIHFMTGCWVLKKIISAMYEYDRMLDLENREDEIFHHSMSHTFRLYMLLRFSFFISLITRFSIVHLKRLGY